MGDCRHCGQPAGFLRRRHRACADAYSNGRASIAALASAAAARDGFREAALQEEAADIARGSYLSDDEVRAAIADGWRQAVRESVRGGVVSRQQEERLRAFRDRMALSVAEVGYQERDLRDAVARRLLPQARAAALAVDDDGIRLDALDAALHDSDLTPDGRRDLVTTGWEAAVEGALEDGVLSLDEEQALIRYLHRFNLDADDVDDNGAHLSMVQGAVIREAAEGLVPNRIAPMRVPFNMMKSEQLVWVLDDVDYLETKVRRERRGTSHGLSIRVAKGLYYRPSMFRSKAIEYEETVHADTGLLGITSKHIYFHGPRKRFRVRFDRIVSFDAYDDGIGIMRDAQTAKPQTFRTGDGWFVYNLVTNLASR